ncbi:B3 domain-containing protein REM16 isoform X7 [Medicago truncatula]|uniref:Plant-specific B3-DNA-binding domain protein n=2 Tax=Medicago truncatula TaxID=3880 RepID=G7I576_MEDTR|nr:B3 domain-containing protein REM16 isoform X7 [Medicago truncatula]AES59528.1 plant-specific B3-DNA-binding domain protein [Medicago truncatula]
MGGRDDGQNWDGSRSWEEDIYWTHFQFIHFTQFLQTTTNFQQQLALPKTFSDNLKKKLPENVTLKGPSGVVWNIGLTTRDNTVYFVDGWQQFVNDHSLKENDFLVFKYNGESLFEVLIFDGNSFCEKATSYFVGKCGHAQTEQGDSKAKDNNTSAFNAGVESASPQVADVVAKTTPAAVPSQTTSKRTKKKPVIEVTPVQTKKRGRPPKSDDSGEKLLRDLVACNKEHSEASTLDRIRKEDEKKIAESFTSSFPYFVKILKAGNVGGSRTLRIPYHFSAAHLPDFKIEVTLRNSKGKCWTVNSVPCAKGKIIHSFCGGWMAFVRDNGVNFGDTCIFELVTNYVMQVYIFGSGKEGADNQNGHVKLDSV